MGGGVLMTVPRAERIADVLRQSLAEVIQHEARDPRIGFVTITGIKLSPDLRHAKVYVSRLGDESKLEEALEALNRAAPFFRKSLAGRTGLRFTPGLRFYRDTGVERGRRVEELLREISEDSSGRDTAPSEPD
jgi:ribosome-binding factor A